jgi:hypothetical protein
MIAISTLPRKKFRSECRGMFSAAIRFTRTSKAARIIQQPVLAIAAKTIERLRLLADPTNGISTPPWGK